jgi:hypothetical protein
VARALIVGCGCRGTELGRRLAAEGWAVRGTTRDPGRVAEIEAAGIEAAVADPDRVGTVLDHIADVAVICWLLGAADGEGAAAALNGPRLERLLEEIVDTPVRGVVAEAGEGPLAAANERWRIPYAVIGADPADFDAWLADAAAAVPRALG